MDHGGGVGLGIRPPECHVVLRADRSLEADLDCASRGIERPPEAVGLLLREGDAVVEHGGHRRRHHGFELGAGAVVGEEDVAEVGGGIGIVERKEARERAGEGELERGVAEGAIERERREGPAGGELDQRGAVCGPEARGRGGGEEVEAGERQHAGAVGRQAHRAPELVLQHGEVGGEARGEVGVRARRRAGGGRGGERSDEQRAREEEGIGRHGRGRGGDGGGRAGGRIGIWSGVKQGGGGIWKRRGWAGRRGGGGRVPNGGRIFAAAARWSGRVRLLEVG